MRASICMHTLAATCTFGASTICAWTFNAPADLCIVRGSVGKACTMRGKRKREGRLLEGMATDEEVFQSLANDPKATDAWVREELPSHGRARGRPVRQKGSPSATRSEAAFALVALNHQQHHDETESSP